MIRDRAQRLTELGRELDTLVAASSSGSVTKRVVDRLADGLSAGVVLHRPELTATGWATEQQEHSGDPAMQRLVDHVATFLPVAPLRYGHYDPLLVEPSERNRVIPDATIRALVQGEDAPPIVAAVYEPAGVARLSHTRVVVSDGPFMLAWIGLFREERFTPEEAQLFAGVVPGLAARLSVERLLWGGAPGSFDAVGQTLELIGRPAFVVNAAGQLVFVNAAARGQIDRDRTIIDDVTEAAASGQRSPRVHSVTGVGTSGVQGHFIVLAGEPEVAAEARLERVVREHALTETQARVLTLLVRGDANKDIATKLHCAPRTVELHVTAILKKCHVESRARLIAWFWTL